MSYKMENNWNGNWVSTVHVDFSTLNSVSICSEDLSNIKLLHSYERRCNDERFEILTAVDETTSSKMLRNVLW